jgi:hypothetical protein
MARLGINTLLIQSIDPGQKHTTCMKLLEDAGIYILIILNGDHVSVPHAMPWGKGYEAMEFYTSIIDSFQTYPNTLGFFITLNDKDFSQIDIISTYKAMVRNMKEYVTTKKYRKIPVGLSAWDRNRTRLPDYMNCGDTISSVDFFVIKTSSTFDQVTCDTGQSLLDGGLVDEYRDFSIPTFFFSTCATDLQGTFSKLSLIYNNLSSSVFSGVIVQSWTDTWTVNGSYFG